MSYDTRTYIKLTALQREALECFSYNTYLTLDEALGHRFRATQRPHLLRGLLRRGLIRRKDRAYRRVRT